MDDTTLPLQVRLAYASNHALLKGEKTRRETLSWVLGQLQKRAIELRVPVLEDSETIAVLRKQEKQLCDLYEQAKSRPSQQVAVGAELALLREFIPAAPSLQQTEELVAAVVQRLGASGMKAMKEVITEATLCYPELEKSTVAQAAKKILLG
jgi:uncharacterized protein YqeY